MRYRVLVLPLSPRRTPTVPRDPSRTLPAPRPSYRQNSNRECRDVLDPCYALIKRTYLFPFLFPFFHFYPQRLFPLSLSLSLPLAQLEGDRVTASPPENPRGET